MSSKILRGQPAAVLGPVIDNPFAPSPGAGGPPEHDAVQDAALAAQLHLEAQEAALAEALERGRREGYQAAKAEHAAAAEAMMAQAARTAARLARETPRLRRDAESDVVRLALAIARRVIHREVSLDQHAIQGLVRVAIDRLNSRDIVRIRTHPSHREVVANVLDAARMTSYIQLIEDPTLVLGDLIFETAHGELDASIDSQLKEIELGIADRLGR